MAYYHKRGCTCGKKKKCTCGAKWSFTVDVGIYPTTGKRKQETGDGFSTKADAELAVATILYELKNGLLIKESCKIFKDFSTEWLKDYKTTHKVKPGTVRIRRHETNLMMPYFEFYKIKDIKKKMYQDMLNDLKEKGYADNTISGVHSTGRMIFKMAKEYDLIKTDPTEYARLPRTLKTVEELESDIEIPKYLEKEELTLFLETAKTKGLPDDYEMFSLLSYTGMRVGEMAALKHKDIDFEGNTLSITKTYYNPSNNTVKYELVTPKTTGSRRTIDVDRDVLDLISKHLVKQKAIRMKFRDIYHDKDFVFVNSKRYPGYPYLIKIIEERMARILRLAGLNKDLTPHSLRHTHTSLLAEAGATLPEIMDRLGHINDDTTKIIYLHVTKPKKKETSQKFSELMKTSLIKN